MEKFFLSKWISKIIDKNVRQKDTTKSGEDDLTTVNDLGIIDLVNNQIISRQIVMQPIGKIQ